MLPMLQHPGYIQQHPNNPSSSTMMPYNMQQMLGMPTGMQQHGAQLVMRDPQQQQQQQQNQQQVIEAHQLAAAMAAREQQEMLRTYEQQQPPPQQYHSGFDAGVYKEEIAGDKDEDIQL
ncbi:hypothetical protein K7X08_033703 [Anisodus acutangulus]|uniref:Uncharacterized protein n=1 Tax=Anisodus acutangulus TaxID=402998 RepID=A0A9Q1M4N0_9SOLA|nr:hypothetical protein K7X08_033703 [Anisodus acutangulus]